MMKNRKPRKDGRYSVNISFTATETSLLSWADRNGNFSAYVKRLIKEDMERSGASTNPLQSVLLNLLSQEGLKDILQNNGNAEGFVSHEEPEEPPKVNKSKIKNIMKKKEKKEE